MASRHPKYLLPLLTASELDDWKAFFQLYPFGMDQLMGVIAAFHADYINAHSPEGTPPVEPQDLMPGMEAEARWERIQEAWLEDRREKRLERARERELAGLSEEERNAKLVAEFIRARQAAQGR